jgi:hypothetical protein
MGRDADRGGGSWVLVAVLPGLDHLLLDPGPATMAERLASWVPTDVPGGRLMDGVWAAPTSAGDAARCTLELLAHGAAVGLAWGQALPQGDGGPPVGLAALLAAELARRARPGELLALERDLSGLSFPTGVGCFRAPEALWPGRRPVMVLKDYRGPPSP